MKRILALTFVLFVAFGATAASAAWGPGSSGSGTSTGKSLGVPTSVAANTTGSSSIQVTWAAPGGASPVPSQYVVRRTAPTSATVCTVSAPTVSCDDTGLTGSTSYSYTVQSRLGTNWVSAVSGVVSATTTAPPTLNLALVVAGSKTAGAVFNVTLTATTNGTTTNTAYSGTKVITFSGPSNSPSGATPVYPASVLFASGVGTASVTLKDAETVTLGATDGAISGSTSVTVVAAAQNQLQFTSSSVDCSSGSVTVGNSGSWITKVSVFDAYLNPSSGTARTVNLTRSPTSGAWSPLTLGILAANVESTSSSTYTRAAGNTDVTVTAAASGLTSDTCVVKK